MEEVGGGSGVYVGGVELRGVGKVGILAGELLDQSHEFRGTGFNLHWIRYVHNFDGFLFVVGLVCFLRRLSSADAAERCVVVAVAAAAAAVHFGREKVGFFNLFGEESLG